MLRERMSTFMELGSYRKRPECCGKRTLVEDREQGVN